MRRIQTTKAPYACNLHNPRLMIIIVIIVYALIIHFSIHIYTYLHYTRIYTYTPSIPPLLPSREPPPLLVDTYDIYIHMYNILIKYYTLNHI